MQRTLISAETKGRAPAAKASAHSIASARFSGGVAGRRALLVLVAVAAVAGVACSGGQRSSGQNDAPANAFAPPAGQERARFSGMVVDGAGLPVPNVGVAMCGSACWPAWTDADGRFVYEELPVERYALDVRGDSVTERTLTSVVFPVELVAGSQELPVPIQLQEAVSVPAWDGTRPVRFAGLSLIPTGPVERGALQPAGAEIGGARIPPAAWPNYRAVDGVPYRPVAMWASRRRNRRRAHPTRGLAELSTGGGRGALPSRCHVGITSVRSSRRPAPGGARGSAGGRPRGRHRTGVLQRGPGHRSGRVGGTRGARGRRGAHCRRRRHRNPHLDHPGGPPALVAPQSTSGPRGRYRR